MTRTLGDRLFSRLRRLDDVMDRGLLAGSEERREGKALMREIKALLADLRGYELAALKRAREAKHASQ